MNPEQTPQESQTSPAPVAPPATPLPPNPQTVPQPPVSPASQAPIGQPDITPVLKKTHTTGIFGTVLGLALLVLSIVVGSWANIPFAVVMVVSSVLLYRAREVGKMLLYLKILGATIALGMIIALLLRGGTGLLQIVLIIFIVDTVRAMHKAGLTTSSSPLFAKPR